MTHTVDRTFLLWEPLHSEDFSTDQSLGPAPAPYDASVPLRCVIRFSKATSVLMRQVGVMNPEQPEQRGDSSTVEKDCSAVCIGRHESKPMTLGPTLMPEAESPALERLVRQPGVLHAPGGHNSCRW